MKNELFIFASWSAYYGLHSFFAATEVKQKIVQNSPFMARFYRLAYSFLAIALFVGLIFQFYALPSALVFKPFSGQKAAGWALIGVGGAICWAAFKNYDLAELLGIDLLKKRPLEAQAALRADGLNRFIRHPLYFGTLFFFVGFWLDEPTFSRSAVVLSTAIYLPIGIALEERKLRNLFGAAYVQYAERIRWRLIPFVW